ncbi:acetylxylan esterase [Kineosporia succinea]|uniref:Cephalosporin-C deacetylase n=1 Tax=Kineosporia succinea TaxID=84632 RepID=A0ABT9NY24_9ACTN|nr:acetylxylan esterase [Kineosporia succinea]MDP9825310.1 cephalosporin-C deacetylase [Kineosporia succinea]
MGYADLPLDQLRTYTAETVLPPDFSEFWRSTLKESREASWAPRREKVDNRLTAVDTWDVTFAGFGGQPVKAWLHLPANRGDEPLPALVEYMGYGMGRGLPHERVTWALAGYAHLVMDTRGQGGDTEDAGAHGPSVPGFLTRGWESNETHYYRRLYTDAALAVEVARGLAEVDAGQVLTVGGSQGGGLAIAGGVLGEAQAVLPDVPFLCDFPRAAWIASRLPYQEISNFLARRRPAAGQLLNTLSYFDAVNFARTGGTVPALFSVALMDLTCPPSTVYGAYNAWSGEKQIREWAYNDHEGGQFHQQVEQFDWLRQYFG